MFGNNAVPPPSPAPPPNPPTYAASSISAPSTASMGRFGGASQSILTGPLGAPATGEVQRKSLLGQ